MHQRPSPWHKDRGSEGFKQCTHCFGHTRFKELLNMKKTLDVGWEVMPRNQSNTRPTVALWFESSQKRGIVENKAGYTALDASRPALHHFAQFFL